jgi:hypothetical protein
MPFRLFLFQLELPYISMLTDDDIQNGFGDPAFRLRFKAWAGHEKVVYLLSGVRLGSLPFLLSDETLFPYSTGSLDFSIGVAFVDTVASVAWWVSGTATYPTRLQGFLEDSDLYGRHATLGGGLRVPIRNKMGLQAGALGYFPSGRSGRSIYFVDVDWRYSGVTAFYVHAQAEGGSEANRVIDYAIGIGTKITF